MVLDTLLLLLAAVRILVFQHCSRLHLHVEQSGISFPGKTRKHKKSGTTFGVGVRAQTALLSPQRRVSMACEGDNGRANAG